MNRFLTNASLAALISTCATAMAQSPVGTASRMEAARSNGLICSQCHFVIDGQLDPQYGNPKAAQGVHTGFGNASDGVPSYTNGSELDAGFMHVDVDDGNLYLFFAGNLESNFNKLDVFIDSIPDAGQNELRSDNPDIDFNGLNRMGSGSVDVAGVPTPTQGLRFDADFAADLCFMTTIGGYDATAVPPVMPTQYANIAQILTDGGGAGAFLGSGQFSAIDGINLIDDQVYGCQVSINNSNVGGANGDSLDPGSGCGVTTGIEVRIPLVLLGWDGSSDIKVCAFINGNGHDYASNQFLGALPMASANLGGDGTGGWIGTWPAALRFSLADIEGDQYFSSAGADACLACFGDIDGSLDVDSGDVALALLDFGPCPGCSADLDGTAEVDFGDIALILLSAGPCN